MESVTDADKDRRASERFYGRFERQFALPTEIQEEKVTAKFNERRADDHAAKD